MAITTTTINGTDSLAASRVTINDNFESIKSALNDILSIIDISTGKIDNSTFGSDNDTETEDLKVKGAIGIQVTAGNISIDNGNITAKNFIEFGNSSGVKVEKLTRNLTSGNVNTLIFSGVGATGGTGNVAYIALPRLNTAVINDIQAPYLGALVYDLDLNKLKVCTASGVTGTRETITSA